MSSQQCFDSCLLAEHPYGSSFEPVADIVFVHCDDASPGFPFRVVHGDGRHRELCLVAFIPRFVHVENLRMVPVVVATARSDLWSIRFDVSLRTRLRSSFLAPRLRRVAFQSVHASLSWLCQPRSGAARPWPWPWLLHSSCPPRWTWPKIPCPGPFAPFTSIARCVFPSSDTHPFAFKTLPPSSSSLHTPPWIDSRYLVRSSGTTAGRIQPYSSAKLAWKLRQKGRCRMETIASEWTCQAQAADRPSNRYLSLASSISLPLASRSYRGTTRPFPMEAGPSDIFPQ